QRVRAAVRERALHVREAKELLPEARVVKDPEGLPADVAERPPLPPPPPDLAAVNESWQAVPSPGRGWRRLLDPLVRLVLGRHFASQAEWNARQVRLDNELLAWVEARFATTHRHYDAVLGQTGRHLGEVDERHMILQEELVAHVHDLVKRIDLVLGEAEKGRVGLEHALRDVRARLARLEERLGRG
ncbi:MAG TPA: hypothetical protein VLL75_11875, partial [Vicinamibacteria bacterium]|nr:hypothetical protein [Vicinamibacteria bacterium]